MFIQVPNTIKKRNSKAYNHKLYRKNSSLLKAIYDGFCQVCNTNQSKIEVHHNDRNNNNHDIFNLVHCCQRCHKLIHMGNSKINGVKESHMNKFEQFYKMLRS